jgi:predicted tellurium resistance membrane protein TerC
MESTLSLGSFVTLGLLILLQAVLGFDNLLYISLESKKAPVASQAKVRRLGIGLAIVFRIILLFLLVRMISYFQDPLFHLGWTGVAEGTVNLHSLIVLFGGIFIIYTATKEIWHMMGVADLDQHDNEKRSVAKVVFWIVAMNVVFSFDSILSAMALSDEFIIMAIAIVIGGILMIWLSDHVTEFLQKNRMYEVVGLFILFLVGIMLISEGGHLAHLKFFGYEVTPLSKTTFYFVIFVMVIIDLVQSRYRRKLDMLKMARVAS